MRGRTIAACAVATLAMSAAAAAPASGVLRAAVEACQERLDPQIDVGYARIAARCPELVRRLESSEWRRWLPQSWRDAGNDLSVRGLEALVAVIEREQMRSRTGRRPGTGKLHDVLEDLGAERTEQGGAFERFRRWVETLLEQPVDREDDWMERLLRRGPLPRLVVEILTYVAIAGAALLAVLIVANEVRAAGFMRRRREPREPAMPLERRIVPRVTPEQLANASLSERPALILRLVFERLAQLGRLPRPGSLTLRQAQALAHLPDPKDRARLASLAATAEQVRFARSPPASELLGRAVEEGKSLLGKLQSARARAS